jgi:hypothetical protein
MALKFHGDIRLLAQTAQRALALDAQGKIVASAVTATELGYLSGVTSAIQTQLDAKLSESLPEAQIFVGNALDVATPVALSGQATIAANGALTLDNDSVIAKLLTGYSAAAGTVTAADSILSAIQKIDGNVQALGVSGLTDNRIIRADGANALQDSPVTLDDAGNLTGVNDLTMSGNLTVNGTTTTINTATLDVQDKNISVNIGGTTALSTGAGINIKGDADATVGFFRVDEADNSKLEFKAPTSNTLELDIEEDSTLRIQTELVELDQNLSTTSGVEFDSVSAKKLLLTQGTEVIEISPQALNESYDIDLPPEAPAEDDLPMLFKETGVANFAKLPSNKSTHTQAIEANWTVATNANVSAHLDELASRMVTVEDGVLANPSDIKETQFTIAADDESNQNITGLTIDPNDVRMFTVSIAVEIDATTPAFEAYKIKGLQKAAGVFDLVITSLGDDVPISFSITALGQFQYSIDAIAGFNEGTLRFKLEAISVAQ